MISPPTYFEAIRKQSADRWDQLDSDNVLAAPWHQLFKQIQSPRHVISELLQNADDAGATNATVRLDGGQFAFTHNGQDFEEQHFASLCRFGYSNKRSLHTIGFRGIGFKSTFSLGDEVRVLTPTLRVAFHRRRFTEPIWLNSDNASDGTTTFSVATQDSYRRAEIEKNSASWLESPASLLFFRSVRTLQIGDDIAAWQPHAPGPVENSEWFSLAGSDSPPVLLIRSLEEEFPEEAIAEIREERMISDSEESDLPPCAIEVVLGLEGRLYVVLPTGVCTSLPFACNGPFIQDPARLKIKDPETSPTNRWLLERVGQLAATAMLQWLNRSDLTIAERSQAYRLLVPRGRFDNSLEGDCETIISESFHKTISDEPFLLAESEELFNAGGCLAVPAWLTDVWSPEQVSTLFDEQKRPILENSIDADSKAMLASSGYLPEIGVGDVLQVLRDQHLPRPGSWLNLLDLWNALAEKITARRQSWEPSWKGICIVPVQGQECLYSMTEVVRLGEKRLLHSDDDWDFLSRHLLVMNPNWTRFIAEQRRDAEASENSDLAEMVHNADRVLEAIGLADSSEVSKVMERVSQAFFTEDETSDDDSIRLAQIAAALDANVPVTFQFIARDGSRISRGQNGPVIADLSTDLDLFVDDDWCERHVLHDGYGSQFKSCTPAEWREWIESGRSGLLQFVPLIQHSQHIYRRSELKRFLNERGYEGEPYYRYVTNNFVIDDWDYALEHWQHWETLADDDKFWGQLLNRILVQPPTYWQNALSAKAYQIATTGSRGQVGSDSLTPAWILKLRGHRCLQDTWGNFRAPAELLRRTPETEALLDVEPFVRADLDTESTRPLLARLGVRDTPTGTNNLLERLRALATVEHPPFFEVKKWCHRLDNVAAKCSTEELDSLKETFQSERLVYTSDNTWATASQVFLNPGDEAPGVPVVHEELRGLTLWQRIGVEERPTADLVIDWLQTLPTGEKLAPDDLRRVREVIARYPNRVWDECGRWLNLEGEWVSVETLRYQLSMQSLVATRHLFPPIRQQVADLQRLPYEVVNQPPFCHLASLASVIAEQVEFDLASSGSPKSVAWLTALGNGIARITFEDAAKDERTQQLGRRLAKTCWLTLSPLQTIPYIDGTPAGTGRTADAVWDGTLLYVDDKPMARLFRPIAQELGRPFEDDELADAIKTCADRTTDFINEYLALNFTLLPQHSEEATTQVDEPKTDESVDSDDPFDSPEAENVDEESDEDEDTLTDDTDVEPIDDGSGNGEINEDEPGEIKPERPTPPRPTQPPLIVRYALTQGFRKDVAQGRFYHADGRWIQRSGGQAFPWDVYSATGELVRSLWTKEHCLERDPLQLPAEIWKLCENNPDLYSLVVTMPDGKPLELSGRNLQEMKDKGHIMLFPATYRLVYQNGQ